MLKFCTKNCAFDLLQIPEPKFEMQIIGFMKQILKSKKKPFSIQRMNYTSQVKEKTERG